MKKLQLTALSLFAAIVLILSSCNEDVNSYSEDLSGKTTESINTVGSEPASRNDPETSDPFGTVSPDSSDEESEGGLLSDNPSDTASEATSDDTSDEASGEASDEISDEVSNETSDETSDETSVETHLHVFIGTSCTAAGKCACGIKNKPLGHDFIKATCTEPGSCKRCGITVEPLGHDLTKATCTEPASCKRCGMTEGAALGHSYSGGKCKRCKDTGGPLTPDEAKLFKNKLTDEENAMALAAAREIAGKISAEAGLTDIDRIGMAAQLVSQEYYKGSHSEKGKYYNTAYGVFIEHESSCAGCCRALGLVLSCLGYEWNHVNEHLWTHQWVTLNIDGQAIWADGQIGWVGFGDYPFA